VLEKKAPERTPNKINLIIEIQYYNLYIIFKKL
jgi:hypothetical protein